MSDCLVIADSFLQPDKASGDLRFYTLLTLLAREHRTVFCALNSNGTVQPPDDAAKRLQAAGLELGNGTLLDTLKHFRPDIVWFEFHHQARQDYLGLLQRHCPDARILIDSVDVHFNRLEARARATGNPEDAAAAAAIKVREVAAYANADMVIAVSEDDRRLLQRELPDMPVEVIPNIHAVPAFPDPSKRRHGELIFVGGFRHDPNVDAMLYFCKDVMPLISAACPDTRLRIIGSNPPDAILALASERVEVVGYVPETTPYLERAYVSVAPLRYGGGMKGKVGEAMSHGLPVVATSFGAEGFGLEPGNDLLIGDDAETFAAQVIALLNDADLHARIAQNGHEFVAGHYSVPVVERTLDFTMQRLVALPPRKIPLRHRMTRPLQRLYERHVAWRLTQK